MAKKTIVEGPEEMRKRMLSSGQPKSFVELMVGITFEGLPDVSPDDPEHRIVDLAMPHGVEEIERAILEARRAKKVRLSGGV